MRKIFLLILVLGVTISACVDDYTDANPPRRLDAPTLRISETGNTQKVLTIPVDRFQNTFTAYVGYGEPSTFTISVIDAPGKVSAVSVTPSVPDFGTVTLNASSVAALQGKEVGEFTFTFTPNPNLGDTDDRLLNLVVTVTDSQTDEKGESRPKTTTLTLPTHLVACITEGLEGTYKVTAASGNLDGGAAYTLDDLETELGGEILVEIETTAIPGRYVMDEVTGGVWPAFYPGRANPALLVDLCGTSLSGHSGGTTAGSGSGPLRTFDIEGTVSGNGTITMTWSYVRDDAPTPANPAKGTLTLTKQ
ncbi:MAG: hypothetical protein ACOYXT_27895 [Bacteroidota bacterium]